LQTYLDDSAVEEIWVNSPDHVFVRTRDGSHLTSTILTQSQIQVLVERMLKPTGRRLDLSNPFVDATLADGSRLHVVIPDITHRNWAVNIRKFDSRICRLEHLVASRSLTVESAHFLTRAVVAGLNLVVSGGTGAGKTTLLTCLLGALNYLAAANAPARFANFNFSATTSYDTVLVSTTATFLPLLRGAFTGPVTLSSSALATTPIY
jgi:pilus assembly protein CpaF